MVTRGQIYRCTTCGNIIEILHGGANDLVCCGNQMELLTENTKEASREKHIPVIEKVQGGVLVKVGSVPHPMEDAHYIEWIELEADGSVYRKFLKPGDAPEAMFHVTAEVLTAREYCNLHGLWKA